MKTIKRYYLAYSIKGKIIESDITSFSSIDSAYKHRKISCLSQFNTVIEETKITKVIDRFSNPLNHEQGGD